MPAPAPAHACAIKYHAPNAIHVNANLYALFEGHFPDGAEQPLLVIPNGPVIHYDDIGAASARIAHALVAAGCRNGDRVAVQTDKHWQVLALYLACLRAGLVYLPLNTGYQRSELDYFFADAEPRVIVCSPERLGLVATLARGATVLTLDGHGGELMDRADAFPETFATVESAPDDLAAILYTSGTTGRSKGAMLTHRNLASNALALVAAWGFTRGDVLLHALPIYHVHGLFVAIHCVLLSGSHMLWLPKFDAKEVASLLPRATRDDGRADVLHASRRRADVHPRQLQHDPAVRVRLGAAAAGDIRSVQRTYGTNDPRTLRHDRDRHEHVEPAGGRARGRHGRQAVARRRDARRRRRRHARSRPGTSAPSRCAGPNVFAAYWRMPDKTREEFTSDGFFKTGDMGEWVADGPGKGYLRLVGRAKDLVITGGLNVYPKEIEERIDEIDGVVETAIIGIPDPDLGESVTAVVVARSGHTLTEGGIISALKADIASFKVPKHVHFVDDLPRNAMGKVQKNVLRERFGPPVKA